MKYLDELKKLGFPTDQYAIFGSGPLAIRGLRENKDLDLIVKPELWGELSKRYDVKTKRDTKYVEIGENIEAYIDWPTFEEATKLVDDAEIFGGIRFVKLKYVLKWKKFRNKPKDQQDIRLIEEYLRQNPE